MSCMFSGCSSLTELDVSRFDTSKVEFMYSMFSGCSSLTELDVSRFDTSNVTYMFEMFRDCCSLETIYASPSADWNRSSVENGGGDYMFSGCFLLEGGNGTKYSSSNVDVTYAHVDTEGNPGYFTAKN
ncbi:BspA family leucine-rich repeat surface protein [Treponema sp.]|uniref:BspA family leucine-rich repeat surface protein n=1 Tax=Treponema sp. TaxID=166 RepID=UPI00338F0F44